MILYLVLPCFNEEEILQESVKTLCCLYQTLFEEGKINCASRILFVDDGSADKTWNLISEIHKENEVVEGIRLSSNKGHQTAIYAGIETSLQYADAIITMDADLQQDPLAVPQFLDMYHQGYDVVCGIRKNRNTDSFLKKATASAYYMILKILGCSVIEQSADYRLLSKKAADALIQHKENNLFIRGLVPALGFRRGTIYFDVGERKAGQSKYTCRKMMKLALDGVTSFSIQPIRMVLCMGITVSAISIVMILYIIYAYFTSDIVSGWASLATAIWFLGGVQLIGTGIVGEYVGRTYMESKHRPRYFIEDSTIKQEGK